MQEVLAAAIAAIKRAMAARGSVADALAPAPECAPHLPLTDLDRSAQMGCFISGYVAVVVADGCVPGVDACW